MMLNNALAQTGWQGGLLDEANWRRVMLQRLQDLDWKAILTDVSPFIEPGFNMDLLSLVNLERVLGE